MEKLIQTKGKLLGVDFGDKRTGLAVSNEAQSMASGIGQVSAGNMQKTAEAVAGVARERRVAGIIVGLPVNMDGSHGPRAAHAEKFAGILSRYVDVPVSMLDERMTTMAASRYLNETDTRGQKRKGVIDTLSAEILLQNGLDKLRFLRQTSVSDEGIPTENASTETVFADTAAENKQPQGGDPA